jgi:hypothetical protein
VPDLHVVGMSIWTIPRWCKLWGRPRDEVVQDRDLLPLVQVSYPFTWELGEAFRFWCEEFDLHEQVVIFLVAAIISLLCYTSDAGKG